jgi:tetratricopeptide (TPR) repeat protein
MKHFISSFLVVLLGSVLSFSQIRNDLSGSVSGMVRSTKGAPVGDARVELHNAKTGELFTSGYTNAQGAFEFANVPNGVYELIATSGLSEVRENVNVPAPPGISVIIATASHGADAVPGEGTVSVAQFKVPRKARDLFKKAQDAAHKNKLEDVNKYLTQALEIYPAFAEALTFRGILKLDANQVTAAIDDLEKAVRYDANAGMSYLVLGAAYNLAKRFDVALRISDHGVGLMPTAWQGYFEMAKSYIGKADYPRAIQQIDRAISLAPQDFAPVHLVKAHALLSLKNYSEAMGELQAFLERAPKNDPNTAQAMAMMDQAKAFTATSKK